MALRARGSSLQVLSKVESTAGTAATGNYTLLPVFTYELSATQELTQDNVLSTNSSRRNVGDPSLGPIDVAGNARVPLDLENFGNWCHLLFGAATDTGTTNYTHTWKSGLTTLPSATQEKGFRDASEFFLYTYVKANSLSVDFTPSGSADATIGLMGQDEAIATSTGGGTPQWAGMTRFHRFMGSITRNGSELANVTAASFQFSNGLEQVRDIRASLSNNGVDEGLVTASGSLTVRFSDDTLITDAIAQTSCSLALALTISSVKSLAFTFPRVFLGRPSIPVSGPGGIEVQYPWQAAHDTSSSSLMTTVLKNQTAAYS